MSGVTRSPMRDHLVGYHMDNDRLWVIHTPEFSGAITEYNDELTGFDPRFNEIDSKIFYYGGNAYYILGRYCDEKGWRVEELEDRR
jgi:hypothetical protein